jgi:cellulose synthase/poly-beta-1,6-N-acetylglucosamine synthase-like glycosyltransferase
VVIPGYNQAETVETTLRFLWGSYPRLEIIVVDDGSSDGMASMAGRFARAHAGVLVLRVAQRSGKSPALNLALAYTRAEVIVSVDADSHLGPSAIWEIVQPLRDPQVGVVSAAVLARNAFTNLVTWLQAYEYLHTIFVGRLLSARLGILGIASGALAAFRRTAIDQTLGWDVAPGEDLDLTVRVRKSGYRVAYTPYAQCLTDVPTTWWRLIKQRLRWERSGIIRHHCRKHIDMAYFWTPGFRFSNFCVLLDNWFFNLFCMYAIWAWVIWICFNAPAATGQMLLTLYLCYLFFEIIQILAAFLYSNDLGRDSLVCAIFPVVPFYQVLLLLVRLVATTEELLLRKSFADTFAPARTQEATWHW